MADTRVRDMVSAPVRLTATDIVAEELGDEELAALGLAPARARLQVTGEQGALLADVALGVAQPGRGILPSGVDSPIVYRVDETVAERVPVDAAAFEAGFVGEVDPPDDVEELWVPGTDDVDALPDAAAAPIQGLRDPADARFERRDRVHAGAAGAAPERDRDRARHASRRPHLGVRSRA